MTTTSTGGQIIAQVVEETGIGFVIPSYTGTTTTLTLTNSYLEGPFSGSRFPIGSPIIVTSTMGLGDTTYVSNYVPSTGVITVSPAITTASTDAILLYPDVLDHPDRLLEAVNRAVNNRIHRLQKTPLTYVPDGDLMGTTVTDFWTGSNATPTYVTPTFPLASSAEYAQVGVQRVLQSVTSGATNYVRSNLIDVALNATVTAYQWYFQTAIRVVSGTGDAELLVWDETNNAQITVNVIVGSDTHTHTTTSLGFVNITGTLNIPATCKQISFRLVSNATTTTIQMQPIVAYPVDAVSFPLPNRIIGPDYIGNFHYGTPVSATSGPYSIQYSDPITTEGRTHHIEHYGDHMTVVFNFRPLRPVYFDEWVGDTSLSLLSSTSSFYLDHIVKWAKYELFKYLYVSEPQRVRDTRYGSVPVPSRWKVRAIEAKREAEQSEYEQDAITVYGRV